MKNSERAAFPLLVTVKDGFMEPIMNEGLTKREYFAAMAMQGLCAETSDRDNVWIAKRAKAIADELLNQLES